MRSHKIGVMLAKAAQSVPQACIMHRRFGLSKQPKAAGEQQAMVVEPPLVSHLEDRIAAMCKAGDARRTALLGQWLVGVGVLRHKHLNLSSVLKITPSTVHCFCAKGKQAKLRRGFYWCVPATFSNSFAWTKPWVDQFQLLSRFRQKHCGLVFDMRGRPWSRLESVRATQDEFRAVLEEPSLRTSYSWRRLGTTVGLLANFSVPQLAALGDWGDRISWAFLLIHLSACSPRVGAVVPPCKKASRSTGSTSSRPWARPLKI